MEMFEGATLTAAHLDQGNLGSLVVMESAITGNFLCSSWPASQ
jgi:hypothetical protein